MGVLGSQDPEMENTCLLLLLFPIQKPLALLTGRRRCSQMEGSLEKMMMMMMTMMKLKL